MITSTANQQIKNLVQLQKKGKARKDQDVFIAEGLKMYQEAPQDKIVRTYISESFLKNPENSSIKGLKDAEVLEDRIFDYVSDTKTPQGIMCIVRQRHDKIEDILKEEKPLIMILENLQDPGNLGTIIRTAEGAGVTGIIMSSQTVDIYNPKTIRSTMGSVYRVPCVRSEDIYADIDKVKEAGVRVYAAHLKGKSSYTEEDYSEGTAFLIGNEGNGLSREMAEKADKYILIPMCGRVESLNAAVASTILMFEARRQRN